MPFLCGTTFQCAVHTLFSLFNREPQTSTRSKSLDIHRNVDGGAFEGGGALGPAVLLPDEASPLSKCPIKSVCGTKYQGTSLGCALGGWFRRSPGRIARKEPRSGKGCTFFKLNHCTRQRASTTAAEELPDINLCTFGSDVYCMLSFASPIDRLCVAGLAPTFVGGWGI